MHSQAKWMAFVSFLFTNFVSKVFYTQRDITDADRLHISGLTINTIIEGKAKQHSSM